MAFSYGQRMFDGAGDICLGKGNSFKKIFTQSNIGGNGRRKCAAGAVGMALLVTFAAQPLAQAVSVGEVIVAGFTPAMPPFDQNRLRTRFQ